VHCAHTIKAGIVYLQCEKLCDPCLSASEVEHFTWGAIQMSCYLYLHYVCM